MVNYCEDIDEILRVLNEKQRSLVKKIIDIFDEGKFKYWLYIDLNRICKFVVSIGTKNQCLSYKCIFVYSNGKIIIKDFNFSDLHDCLCVIMTEYFNPIPLKTFLKILAYVDEGAFNKDEIIPHSKGVTDN